MELRKKDLGIMKVMWFTVIAGTKLQSGGREDYVAEELPALKVHSLAPWWGDGPRSFMGCFK